MELKKYYKPAGVIAIIGAIISKIGGYDLIFYSCIIIILGLAWGSYDQKEGKSGFFYIGLLGLIIILAN